PVPNRWKPGCWRLAVSVYPRSNSMPTLSSSIPMRFCRTVAAAATEAVDGGKTAAIAWPYFPEGSKPSAPNSTIRSRPMLSAEVIHNLSVVMPRPIPWYGSNARKESLWLKAESLRHDFQGFRHPRQHRHRSGSQLSHQAAAMHLDRDLADREF